MMDAGTFVVEPKPAILIESLRDIGYSFKTALADIVDNSIAAGAAHIQILSDTENDPILAVLDDGLGLSPDELLESMRMGSVSPRDKRKKTDLGRFGLGMKTASFSQCRRLTVVSSKAGIVCGYCWDLDHVVATDSWELLPVEDPSEVPFASELGKSGTAVIWEKMDRVIDGAKNKEASPECVEEIMPHEPFQATSASGPSISA